MHMNFYIPTIDDVDDFESGKFTIEQIQARWTESEDPVAADEPVVNPDTVANPIIVTVAAEAIQRDILYHAKGSKDLLKADCKPNEVLVSRDSNETGAKSYRIIDVEKWIKLTQRYDINEYECIRGACYPYIDIESERDGINVVDMLNHSIGVFVDALREASLIVEGVAISDSSRPGKTSFHVVIHTDKVFENTTALKEFVYTNVKPRFTENVSAELLKSCQWTKVDKKTNTIVTMDSVDWMVYTTDRVLRFINQSKIGKKVRLTAYTNDDIILPCPLVTRGSDYLVGQYATQKEIFEVVLPAHVQKTKDLILKQSLSSEPVAQKTFEPSYLSELADLIPNEIINSGTTCCKFIWSLAKSGASNELIHNHCKRTSNYDSEWVDYHIGHAATMSVTIGTLRYWASQANKDAYHALSKKYQKTEIKEEVHAFESRISTTTYHERYVKPFTFDGVDTILLKSHLGTGKTTQLINAITPEIKRILIISGRKSFTSFICGDLGTANLGFKSYDERHHQALSLVPRLVIQVESLWRLADSFEKYDLVAVDESETIAHQFYSEATHRQNLIKNHEIFADVLSTATKVLFADAFLGQRTIQISEALRAINHSQIIDNTFCPYKREAVELRVIKKGKSMPALGEFCNRIMADLKAGKRVAVVWGSKGKAKAFAETFLKKTEYKWRLYSSDSTETERNELKNVNHSWQDLNLLMYTSTITVGISYDPEIAEAQFDTLYLYASAAGSLPRDIAQSLLRCRKIKSNKLVYTVDKNALSTALYGRECIKAAIDAKSAILMQANPVARWERAPKWAQDLYIENENENGAKCIAFKEILEGYLEKSGYTMSVQILKDDGFELKCEKVLFEDIGKSIKDWRPLEILQTIVCLPAATLDEKLAKEHWELLQRKSKNGIATLDEKLTLQKWRFLQQFKKSCTDEFLAAQYNEMYGENKEHLFWNQVNEKHQSTKQYLEFEAKQKYMCAASKKCLKRTVIDKLLPILGIANTSEPFSILVTDKIVQAVKMFEADARGAFLTGGNTKGEGEFTASHAVDVIKMVFVNWNGIGVETSAKRKMVKGVRNRIFTITNKKNEIWDKITEKDALAEELASYPPCYIDSVID